MPAGEIDAIKVAALERIIAASALLWAIIQDWLDFDKTTLSSKQSISQSATERRNYRNPRTASKITGTKSLEQELKETSQVMSLSREGRILRQDHTLATACSKTYDSASGDKGHPVPKLVDCKQANPHSVLNEHSTIWRGDSEAFLSQLPREPIFDLVVTSPPYNIGKSYESKSTLENYMAWQERIIGEIVPRLKADGSLCWQVGNFVDNGQITPLDFEFAPIFKDHKLQLRNRIIWTFGHGLHTKRRFSGRYEVILWYTKTDDYFFELDAVRIPSKYPAKRHFKGPRKGEFSGNPLGKNPEDVWSIPNVKSNHIEKTDHPCQFPVGLIERLVLSMTRPGALVFDPFSGVASAGVASLVHGRRFIGCELDADFAKIGHNRLIEAAAGRAEYRPHDKPLYDHTKSSLSRRLVHDEG